MNPTHALPPSASGLLLSYSNPPILLFLNAPSQVIVCLYMQCCHISNSPPLIVSHSVKLPPTQSSVYFFLPFPPFFLLPPAAAAASLSCLATSATTAASS